MIQVRALTNKRRIWAHTLDPPVSGWQDPPFDGAPFVCVVVNTVEDLAADQLDEVATRIVASGCRYAVCAGISCSSVEDAIDWAYVAVCMDDEDAEDRVIVTTSHRNEPAEDIVLYALNCTSLEGLAFNHYLILFIGKDLDTENAFLTTCHEVER